jgi:imidazolonepropionase-like amidohydrolase
VTQTLTRQRRLPNELPARPGDFKYSERVGAAAIADSPDLVRQRVREQLALGASQIKLMAGGGIASNYDPLDVTQYSVPELRAAVEAAENWGTYVTVHAYTPRAVRQAIDAGVKCIDHGQLLDDATARLMAERGVWWSLQPFMNDGTSRYPPGSINRIKQEAMWAGTDAAYALAKKHGIRTAFGTDALFSAEAAAKQGADLVKLLKWYTPAEALRMATADNAQLLALSGERNSYPGKLGVVQEGALADLLLVDGDPLARLELVADPGKNFVVIMKDGRVYKNTLRP